MKQFQKLLAALILVAALPPAALAESEVPAEGEGVVAEETAETPDSEPADSKPAGSSGPVNSAGKDRQPLRRRMQNAEVDFLRPHRCQGVVEGKGYGPEEGNGNHYLHLHRRHQKERHVQSESCKIGIIFTKTA